MASIYIELGIGLVLAFLLLSLLVSGLNEGLNRLFSIRSKYLWAYLRDIIEGGVPVQTKEGATILARLPTSLKDVLWRAPWNKMPGGDPRPRFAAPPPPATSAPPTPNPATSDLATPTSTKLNAEMLYERLQEIDRAKGGRSSISQIPASRFAAALIEFAKASDKEISKLLEELKDDNSPLYAPLNGLWDAAEEKVEPFRAGVEAWFDGEMQRLSRLYRRSARWVIAVLAVLVALFVGFDSLAYGQSLLSDSAYRTQVVAVASGDPDRLVNLQERCLELERQKGSEQPETDPYGCISDVLSNPALTQLLGSSLVRIDYAATEDPKLGLNWHDWQERARHPVHWPGFLLTVVALLFGAPFWWDILRRLTGVRSSASISGQPSR
jgi:hypothetical protein